MRLFADTRIDFMGLSRVCVTASALLIVASVVVVAVRGLNLGIEFTGGTEIQVRYAERPDVAAVRQKLAAAGMSSQAVTTISTSASGAAKRARLRPTPRPQRSRRCAARRVVDRT